MKKIKLSFPYLAMNIYKQTPGFSACWGDCQFFINEDVDECDYWVVFNHLLKQEEATLCPRANVILLTGEPKTIWQYENKFLQQFEHIITCQRDIKGPGVVYFFQGHPWHVGLNHSNPNDLGLAKSYDELINTQDVPKTKLLSIISSNKQGTAGHRQRYKFALALKDALGDQVDLFGRGINDFNDKWDALAPYKYSIAIENSSYDDYVTEKLFDCYLAHTFPFYYGAPNVDRYFSSESYCQIDINNFDETIYKIREIINNPNHYQEHLNAVVEAKLRYLKHYNLFPLIAEFIDKLPMNNQKEMIILKNPGFSVNNSLKIAKEKMIAIKNFLINRP
jgi:hypothetical protein